MNYANAHQIMSEFRYIFRKIQPSNARGYIPAYKCYKDMFPMTTVSKKICFLLQPYRKIKSFLR